MRIRVSASVSLATVIHLDECREHPASLASDPARICTVVPRPLEILHEVMTSEATVGTVTNTT